MLARIVRKQPNTLVVFLLLLQAIPTIAEAKAASKADVGATLLIKSADVVSMATDEAAPFEVGFKNSGARAWSANGDGAVILRSKVTRESYFYDASTWVSRVKAATAPEMVPSGGVGYFAFILHAPMKPGDYREEMYLEVNGREIPGSRFAIPITVREKKGTAPQAQSVPVQLRSNARNAEVLATKLIQSDSSLTMPALGHVVFEIGYKNTGSAAWPQAGAPALSLRSSAKKESWFYDSTWQSGNVVKAVAGVNPGELAYVAFVLNAPHSPGRYVEKFALYAGEKKIVGTEVQIPITVTKALPTASLASYASVPPGPVDSAQGLATFRQAQGLATSTPPSGIIQDIRDTERLIRAGITYSNDPIQITASKDYEVRDTSGMLLGTQIAGGVTTVIYDRASKTYSVTLQNAAATSTIPVRLAAQQSQPDAIFEILSYSNRPTWSTRVNDNTFRGAIEVNYASATDRVWVINELLLEDYLKGTGETSNSSPYEFQKALMIAARTYALYHLQRGTKNAADNFTVRSTDADQVYRGYGAERRLPNVARAIAETRGVIATYQGNLAITPYYSQSDGRTRAWSEVWGGGPYPWLLSVPDPGCAGLPMLGHGVGMSARGALLMALEGKGFEEILKYYYTGIELRQAY